MQMQSVNSSQISQVGYDSDSNKLIVQFRNGSTYEYDSVPENIYEELLGAGSAGRYFADNVKSSFSYKRI